MSALTSRTLFVSGICTMIMLSLFLLIVEQISTNARFKMNEIVNGRPFCVFEGRYTSGGIPYIEPIDKNQDFVSPLSDAYDAIFRKSGATSYHFGFVAIEDSDGDPELLVYGWSYKNLSFWLDSNPDRIFLLKPGEWITECLSR